MAHPVFLRFIGKSCKMLHLRHFLCCLAHPVLKYYLQVGPYLLDRSSSLKALRSDPKDIGHPVQLCKGFLKTVLVTKKRISSKTFPQELLTVQ